MPSSGTHDRRKALRIEGEMAERVYRFDWSKTPLGPLDGWSLSLRTLVRMVLSSRFPMVLMWGPELTTLYNDAFRPSLSVDGKHPGILGLPGRKSWEESWPVVGPMILGVLNGGPGTFVENQRIPLQRDGVLDYSYWTHGYSPLVDDDGAVAGVLATALETTQEVEHFEYFAEFTTQAPP